MEQKKVMHLDLKPENIIYFYGNIFKICDFGCSLIREGSKVSKANNKLELFGTQNYLAPENFI
jgi:serine/threonine protein kinase